MPDMTRRELIVAGTAGAALATAGGIALAEELGSTTSGAPKLPHDPTPARFALAASKPKVTTKWGTVKECTLKNFPILEGSEAASFLFTLNPGALREPHWHPNAWEFDFCVEGKVQLGVVNPDNTTQIVELTPGDVGFIPQGWAHFIRNPGTKEAKLSLVFGNNQPDDIGLSTMFGGMPTDTFTETLGLKSNDLNAADKPDTTLFFVR